MDDQSPDVAPTERLVAPAPAPRPGPPPRIEPASRPGPVGPEGGRARKVRELPVAGGGSEPDGGRARSRFSLALLALFAAACTVGVFATYGALVRTAPGQRLDEIAMLGGGLGRTVSEQSASPILNAVSVAVVAAAIAAVAVIAFARRRVWVAVSAASVIVGANLTTQLLKKVVLTRPDLDVVAPGGGANALNSFPSGHTTVAASIALALLMVVGPRLRPLVAILGIAYASATGLSTIVMGWHRPSDVIGAVLVCGAWAGGVMLVAGVFRGRTSGTSGTITGATLVLVVGGVLTAAIGTVLAYRLAGKLPVIEYSPAYDFSHTDAALAFLATSLACVGVAATVFGSVMGLVSGRRA